MKKVKAQKGITLIALIITIVVLLILAAVTISAIQGDGIIKHAKNAADKYTEKANEEEKMLQSYIDTMNGLESVESLQQKYQFSYYSSFSKAVADVNNDTIGENADVDKEEAVAGIYTDDEGGKVVVLMQDTTESAKITVSKDLTLNLGGNNLNFTSIGIDTVANNGNTIVIDGRLYGSTISCVSADTANIAAVYIRTGNNLRIDGVTLNVVAENSSAYGVNIASSTENPSTCVISNCIINASGEGATSKAYGIANRGNVTITDSIVKALSDYTTDENGAVAALSIGVVTGDTSSTALYNCNVMGTHSGVQNGGVFYANGGTYEGVGHGGIYFAGAGTTSYVQNAILRECEMPEGYTTNADINDAGLYIGGGEDNNNIIVYMDNCDIYGSKQPIVLRGTSGEQNNKLYISNSKVNLDPTWGIRVDSNTHRLYIGRGNNFAKEDIYIFNSMITTEDIDQIVVNTDEVYIRN